jgi:hypothetical protein
VVGKVVAVGLPETKSHIPVNGLNRSRFESAMKLSTVVGRKLSALSNFVTG